MEEETTEIADIAPERAVKFNVDGAGNYRVQYDDASWKLLLAELPKMSVPDRVNLLSDAWALVQAKRVATLSLPRSGREIARQNRTAGARASHDRFRPHQWPTRRRTASAGLQKIRHLDSATQLRRTGLGRKKGESTRNATLRASLVTALGKLGDEEIIADARERFANTFRSQIARPRPPRRPS